VKRERKYTTEEISEKIEAVTDGIETTTLSLRNVILETMHRIKRIVTERMDYLWDLAEKANNEEMKKILEELEKEIAEM